MALITDREVKALQARAKVYRTWIERGLYIEVHPGGAKYWRFKYRADGKEKRLSFGVYPEISLSAARDLREEARRKLADGVDLSTKARKQKDASALQTAITLRSIAEEWFEINRDTWAPSHSSKMYRRLEKYVFGAMGDLPIDSISTRDLHQLLRPIEARAAATAQRTLSVCSRVMTYAVATGRASTNPAMSLGRVLRSAPVKHRAAIVDPNALGRLLRAIDGYAGSMVTCYALKLLPHLFVRPGELRLARWEEFDLKKSVWIVPLSHLKMRKHNPVPLVVPLSSQVVTLLSELRMFSGHNELVFPGVRNAKRPISDNTLNAALRNLGYSSDEQVAHGFRTTASSLLNQSGRFSEDAIERQLHHKGKNAIRAIYNRAEYLEERTSMMQFWSDYLESLKYGA